MFYASSSRRGEQQGKPEGRIWLETNASLPGSLTNLRIQDDLA
jgi:hypothetical protein